jgi:hypothetical protein
MNIPKLTSNQFRSVAMFLFSIFLKNDLSKVAEFQLYKTRRGHSETDLPWSYGHQLYEYNVKMA